MSQIADQLELCRKSTSSLSNRWPLKETLEVSFFVTDLHEFGSVGSFLWRFAWAHSGTATCGQQRSGQRSAFVRQRARCPARQRASGAPAHRARSAHSLRASVQHAPLWPITHHLPHPLDPNREGRVASRASRSELHHVFFNPNAPH